VASNVYQVLLHPRPHTYTLSRDRNGNPRGGGWLRETLALWPLNHKLPLASHLLSFPASPSPPAVPFAQRSTTLVSGLSFHHPSLAPAKPLQPFIPPLLTLESSRPSFG